jgi:hypothetical protein
MGTHPEAVFDTRSECTEFARDVLLQLQRTDFVQSLDIENKSLSAQVPGEIEEYDEYAIDLHPSFLKKYGLTNQRTWYLKFTMRSVVQTRDHTFCLSLHRLEREAECRGGTLYPVW